MSKRTLVLVEIEAAGETCGSCAHRRGIRYRLASVNGMAGHGRVLAHACALFGGFVNEGRRVEACVRAQVEVDELGAPPELSFERAAGELAS